MAAELGKLEAALHVAAMIELLRTNDLVQLSWAEAMLKAAGIDCLVADPYVAAVEGSIGAFPRRLLVLAEDEKAARRLLEEAATGTHPLD